MNWTTEQHKIKQLATGDVLTMKTHTLKGDLPGPHIHIQASVHGAELQGNAVILQLMNILRKTKIKGSITFAPVCNPYATASKNGTYTYGRFNPVTGHNWNRNYVDIIKTEGKESFQNFVKKNKDLGWDELKTKYKDFLFSLFDDMQARLIQQGRYHDNVKINLMLQRLACKADGVLDLHTGPTATRYLYSAEYQKPVAKHLLFKQVLLIPNTFEGAMDEASFMPWVHLQNELKKHGREEALDVEAFTLEFGSEETFCMDSAAKDVESILNYLAYKKVIDAPVEEKNPNWCLLENYKTLYSLYGGLCDYRFAPGDAFKMGDVLASFYCFQELDPSNPLESCRKDVIAAEDGIIINRCPSSAVHQGMELYQIMTQVFQ